MVVKACLDVEPFEDHDIVERPQFIVCKLVNIPCLEVQRVTMLVVDRLRHLSVGDPIAVTIDNLRITVSFRVVSHTQGNGEVKLLELEIITKAGIEGEVTIGREGVA